MATAKSSNQSGKGLDDKSKAMLYEGCNMTQLCELFRRDARTMTRLLQGVPPTGKRSGYDIWLVAEVAPYIVKPMFDVESYIRRMNHQDLPKHLTKEFWAGQLTKQNYEKNAGLLWSTEKVVEKVGELFKVLRMGILLMRDTVERTQELSTAQRNIINRQMDGLLTDLQERIRGEFVVPEAPPQAAPPPLLQEEDDDY